MKQISHTGRVDESGALRIHYRKVMDALLYDHFRGSEVELTIKKKSKRRSGQQNRYYWGVLVPAIQSGLMETQGEWLTAEQVHEFLKVNFNYKEIVNEKTGEVVKIPLSTTDRTTLEFEEFQDKCRAFADEFLNIQIPLPNEQAAIF